MIQLQLSLIVLLFFHSAKAVSEVDCETIDLRAPGKPMHGSPNFDQGSTSFCWGFAGTQLATAVIQKQNLRSFGYNSNEVSLSPTITLNNVSLDKSHCPMVCEIVRKVLETKKGCSYQDVTIVKAGSEYHPDTGEKITGNSGLDCTRTPTIDAVVEDISDVIGSYQFQMSAALDLSTKNPKANSIDRQKSFTNFLQKRTAKNNLRMADLYNATVAPKCMDLENTNSPFVGSRPVNQVLNSIQPGQYGCDSYQTQAFDSTVQSQMPQCPKLPSHRIMDSKTLMKKVNEVFSSGSNNPVVIDYCYNFLHDGVQNKRPTESLCNNLDGTRASDHKSLLIGRRFNKSSKRCEFLLRNTWGRNCGSLHPLYRQSCEEELKKNQVADTWVPADNLEQVVHGINVISESKPD